MPMTPEERRAYQQAYYQANKAKICAQNRAYRLAHRVETAAAKRVYALAHAEHIRVYQRAYQIQHKDKLRLQQQLYQQTHREQIQAQRRRYAQQNREAINAYSRMRYSRKREEIRTYHKQWRDANIERVRLSNRLSGRRQRAASPDAWRATHRRAMQRDRFLHPERHRAISKKYRNSHKATIYAGNARRRARQRQAPVIDLTAAQWREIKEAFKHCCAYCGRKRKQLAQDHVTPYAHNGSHTLWNVVPACASCNSKKRTGPPLKPIQPLLLTIAPSRQPPY